METYDNGESTTPKTTRAGAHKRKIEESRPEDTKKQKTQLPIKPPTLTVGKKTTPARGKTSKMSDANNNGRQGTDSGSEDAFFKRLTGHIDSANSTLTRELTEKFGSLVGLVREDVRANRESIGEMRTTMERIESEHRKLEQKVERIRPQQAILPGGAERSDDGDADDVFLESGAELNKKARETEYYETARRTLRLWPIKGSTDEDLKKGVVNFLKKVLEVPSEEVEGSNITRVRRTKYTRRSTATLEAAVTFDTIYARDRVSAHGRNLRHYTDDQDKPTAGMKLDYPNHLTKTFRNLEWYGAEMRRIHGDGTRRNMRFDDVNKTLYLDVRLPNREYWHRVDEGMAEVYKKQRDEANRIRSRSALENPSSNMTPLGERRSLTTTTSTERPRTERWSDGGRPGDDRYDQGRKVTHSPNEVIYISPKKRQ